MFSVGDKGVIISGTEARFNLFSGNNFLLLVSNNLFSEMYSMKTFGQCQSVPVPVSFAERLGHD